MQVDLKELRATFEAHRWAAIAVVFTAGAVAGLMSRSARGRATLAALVGIGIDMAAEQASRRMISRAQSWWAAQSVRPFARA